VGEGKQMNDVFEDLRPIEWFVQMTDLTPTDMFILTIVCLSMLVIWLYIPSRRNNDSENHTTSAITISFMLTLIIMTIIVIIDITVVLQQRNKEVKQLLDSYDRCEGATDPGLVHFCAKTLANISIPKWKFVGDQFKSHIFDVYWNFFGMYMANGFYQFVFLVIFCFTIWTYKEYKLFTRVQDNTWKREDRLLELLEKHNNQKLLPAPSKSTLSLSQPSTPTKASGSPLEPADITALDDDE
jgi:hypothetical protein